MNDFNDEQERFDATESDIYEPTVMPENFNVNFILERAKNILRSNSDEWLKIKHEEFNRNKICINYFIPLLLIPLVANFFREMIVLDGGRAALDFFLYLVVFPIGLHYAAHLLVKYDKKFDANFEYASVYKMIAYGLTPFCVCGIGFIIVPMSGLFLLIAAAYTGFIVYDAVPVMFNVVGERRFRIFMAILASLLGIAALLTIVYAIVSM